MTGDGVIVGVKAGVDDRGVNVAVEMGASVDVEIDAGTGKLPEYYGILGVFSLAGNLKNGIVFHHQHALL